VCQLVCVGVASEPLYSETLWTATVNNQIRLYHLSLHSVNPQSFAVGCLHADRNFTGTVSCLIFTPSYQSRLAAHKIGETENINAKSDQCACGTPWQSQPASGMVLSSRQDILVAVTDLVLVAAV